MAPVLQPDDIVALKSDGTLASVERTPEYLDYTEAFQSLDESVRGPAVDDASLRHFLQTGVPLKGTILIRFEPAWLQLVRTSTVRLVVRSLITGDIVKRSVTDLQSGVVINTRTKCVLQPLCRVTHHDGRTLDGLLPPSPDRGAYRDKFSVKPEDKPALLHDIPASDLMYSDYIGDLTPDDLVVYKDWIGKLVDRPDLVTIRLTDGCVVEIMGEQGEQADGNIDSFLVGDILITKKAAIRKGHWIFGRYNANTPPIGTVVSVRPEYLEMKWLQKRIGSTQNEPPRILEDKEWESTAFKIYDRTRWPAPAAETLTSSPDLVSNTELDLRLGQRVRFRDFSAACARYNTAECPNAIPRHDRKDNMGFDMNVFDVVSFQTQATVQWQDSSITTHESVDLVPDSGIDDHHAAWPGEITHTLSFEAVAGAQNLERATRVGVVQTVNAAERIAKVSWNPDSLIEYSRGTGEEDSQDALVRHKIAISPGVVEDISLYDIDTPAQVNVRRGDIVLIDHAQYNPRTAALTDQTWLGEIVDTPLDGSLTVRLGVADQVRDVCLRREEAVVVVRADGTDGAGGDGWDSASASDTDMEELAEVAEAHGVDPHFLTHHVHETAEPAVRFEDEDGMQLEASDVEGEEWESADDDDEGIADVDMAESAISTTECGTNEANGSHVEQQETPDLSETPPQYLVLEGSVPSSHRFAQEPTNDTAAYMKRVQKEHKILGRSTSLPAGVFVRTWESRLDLIRVLILGPSETPYAHAPFIVDIHLPSTYPVSPPKVYYHSWLPEMTSGTHGRLNPNLYEDGTVCLSLLGTWEGAPGEGWSPAGSTILQVIVSILGLVLVREPYYNEAGYENLKGADASKVPSTLYNERVFLRSRGLIITMLNVLKGDNHNEAHGMDIFEDLLRWCYLSAQGQRLLQVVVADIEGIMDRSDGSADPNGLTVMSKGACIPLQRVLEKLKSFLS